MFVKLNYPVGCMYMDKSNPAPQKPEVSTISSTLPVPPENPVGTPPAQPQASETASTVNEKQPEIATPEVPNKRKRILWVILGFLLTVLLTGGGYFLIKNRFLGEQKACTMEAKVCPDGTSVGRTGPNCEFAPCPTETLDETADWKTYTSKDQSFSFKYPKNLYTNSTNEENLLFYDTSIKNPTLADQILNIGVNKYDKSKYQSLNSPINSSDFTDGQGRMWETDMVLGESAFNFSATLTTDQKIYIVGIQSGLVKGDEIIFEENHRKLSNQILSPFKFIEENTVVPTPPAGWKAHKFSSQKLTLFTPTDWDSKIEEFPEIPSTLISFWKKASPSIIPIMLDIKSNWDNTGNAQYLPRTYTVAGRIPAARVDPPKKEEQLQERYETVIYFERLGKVYVFECTHNWVEDYVDTCNKMVETMTFE